jgi:hypothetical protein
MLKLIMKGVGVYWSEDKEKMERDLREKRQILVAVRPWRRSPSDSSACEPCKTPAKKAYLVDVRDVPIHHFTLEGLEDDSGV